MKSIHNHLMRDYSCHAISFIINAFEKSVNFPFNYIKCVAVVILLLLLLLRRHVATTSTFQQNDKQLD